MKNAHEIKIAADVARWKAEGRWIDEGRWIRPERKWASKEYHPTPDEIRAKCKLFRTTPRRQGAHARAPRGGEFAIVTLAGI